MRTKRGVMLCTPEVMAFLTPEDACRVRALDRAEVFYLGGSGDLHSSRKELRRCGWGAAVISDDAVPSFVAGYCGTLPHAPQTVPRAELFAAIAVLERVRRPVTLLADNDI